MVGLFSKTKKLYNALGDERRLSILILLRAKKEMNLEDIGSYLGEESKEILEPHLNILENSKLIQKSGSAYSLTAEGIRRLSELGVTESEAEELAKERETSRDLASRDQVYPIVSSDDMVCVLPYPSTSGQLALLNDEDSRLQKASLKFVTFIEGVGSSTKVLYLPIGATNSGKTMSMKLLSKKLEEKLEDIREKLDKRVLITESKDADSADG